MRYLASILLRPTAGLLFGLVLGLLVVSPVARASAPAAVVRPAEAPMPAVALPADWQGLHPEARVETDPTLLRPSLAGPALLPPGPGLLVARRPVVRDASGRRQRCLAPNQRWLATWLWTSVLPNAP
ncbi:hypothetical protein [Hymenobacter metallicola]|uniref:Uncharacterized protein n=1 Tax=Hymenobacter metallicola TaxID=2563114 RepID=A0A4Z0QHY8_9BACT|nr:hypothetical protein [Hymenobacter metallicola]TGE29687.1 hypothetical protein E5K02_09590 [Hymenobacter metallicola]